MKCLNQKRLFGWLNALRYTILPNTEVGWTLLKLNFQPWETSVYQKDA